jgi:hypothetical protein
MKSVRVKRGVLVCALVASAALAGTAHAGSGWVSCGSDAARLAFNIQTRGLGCTTVKPLLKKLQAFSHVKVIVPRKECSYTVANGWLCYYSASHSPKAQDNELSSFDCRTTEGVSNGGGTTEIRWTDAPGVIPVELLPSK